MEKIYLIFLGPPGSGKGTQAQMLSAKAKLPIISTGELLRHEQEKNTNKGKMIKEIIVKGKLVSNKIVEAIINKRLTAKDANKGMIFDGFPRNKNQLRHLTGKLGKNNVYAILVDVSDKEVKRRLGGRRMCACGATYHLKYNPPQKSGICDLCRGKLFIRNDDRPKVIADRLKLYHQQSEPLIDYWLQSKRLIKINGGQNISRVRKDIEKKIRNLGIKL